MSELPKPQYPHLEKGPNTYPTFFTYQAVQSNREHFFSKSLQGIRF